MSGDSRIQENDRVIAATRLWIERAVIGLNLCPFAKRVYSNGQVRFVVSNASDSKALLDDLVREMRLLTQVSAKAVDNTLLLHPNVLTEFRDFVDFLELANDLLEEQGLDGVLQIASFHPDYQFAGTTPDDVTNYTNRSPYPMLHLLREATMSEAISSSPDTEEITNRNKETMRRLGVLGLVAIGAAKLGRDEF